MWIAALRRLRELDPHLGVDARKLVVASGEVAVRQRAEVVAQIVEIDADIVRTTVDVRHVDLLDALGEAQEHRAHELLLVAEVTVDGHPGDAGPLRDLVHRGLADALLEQELRAQCRGCADRWLLLMLQTVR